MGCIGSRLDFMERLKRNVMGVLTSPVKTYRDILNEERDLVIPAGIVLFSLIVRWISYYSRNRVVEGGVEGFLVSTLLMVLDFLFITFFAYGLSRGLNKDVTFKGFFELLAYAKIPMIIGEAMFFLPSVLPRAAESIFGLWTSGLEVLTIRESIKTSTMKAIIVYVAALLITIVFSLVMLTAVGILSVGNLLKLLMVVQ